MKKYLISFIALFTCTILAACGARDDSGSYGGSRAVNEARAPMAASADMATGNVYYDDVSYEMDLNSTSGGLQTAVSLPAGIEPEAPAKNDHAFRKLIKDANLNVETEEFDFLLVDIQNRVNVLGGYLEHFNSSNNSRFGFSGPQSRYASMTIRIPSAQYESFVNMVGEISNVLNRNENVRDVTLQYVDLESRKESLQVEFDRLLELLARAESIEDIIRLEQRLSEVRYNIEWLGSQLRTFDNLVSYSTIYLNIQEVTELTPIAELTFAEKISLGFNTSLKSIGRGFTNFVIWLAVNSPFLLIWAVILGSGFFIVRMIVKKNKAKYANRAYQMPSGYGANTPYNPPNNVPEENPVGRGLAPAEDDITP